MWAYFALKTGWLKIKIETNLGPQIYMYLSTSAGFKQDADKAEVLPSTSSAAKYHSMRVFCQVMQWKGKETYPVKWGSKITNNIMMPNTLISLVHQKNCSRLYPAIVK